MLPPENAYEKYIEIFKYLTDNINKYSRIEYLAEEGYDILLQHSKTISNELLVQNISDYNHAMPYAARGKHKELVEKLVQLGANDFNGVLIYQLHVQIMKN